MSIGIRGTDIDWQRQDIAEAFIRQDGALKAEHQLLCLNVGKSEDFR